MIYYWYVEPDSRGLCRPLLGVALATVRKWERGTGQPGGAAITLLAVAKRNPEVIREAVAAR